MKTNIKKYETPTLEQMTKLSGMISSEMRDVRMDNMFILFKLSKEKLAKLDEDLFFRNNPENKMEDFEPNYEEVNVKVGEINFKFVENVDN